MEDCIFCKIVRGEVPSQKVHHENDSVVSFLDINQDAPGHTLVVPAEHYRWFQDVPDELSDSLFRVSKRLASELKETYGSDYVRLSIVGTDVPHVHVHLIPRNLTDKVNPA